MCSAVHPTVCPVLMRHLTTHLSQVMERTLGNYPAPLKILDVVATGLSKGRDEGLKAAAKVRS